MTKISKNFTHFSETKFVDSKCGGGCESCESTANPADLGKNPKDSNESYAQFTAEERPEGIILPGIFLAEAGAALLAAEAASAEAVATLEAEELPAAGNS